MGIATRELHEALDNHARADGVAWLNQDRRTIQRDLLGSPNVVAWQEAKAAFLVRGDGAWSELPHLYARYGTPGTAAKSTRPPVTVTQNTVRAIDESVSEAFSADDI